MLSRIDRSCSVAEIMALSGLPETRTLSVLRDLRAKGAIRFEGEQAPPQAAGAQQPQATTSKFGNFVFSPGDLGEEVDLDLEKRKEVLYFHARLDKLNHYELLGVRVLADKVEIKRAYFELSKKFHPDRFYGKNLGSFKARLAEIFHRLSRAWEALQDDARRAEYNKGETVVFDQEDMVELARRKGVSDEEVRRDDERKRRLLHSRGFAKVTRARELIGRAAAELAEGRADAALLMLQDAIQLEPRNEEAKTLLADARKKLEARRAASELMAGERAEQAGDLHGALERYKAAVNLHAESAKGHDGVARMLLSTGGELKEAKHHAERAVALDGERAQPHVTLAMCYHKLGLKKNARREYEAAIELDPKDTFAKAQLKKL